MYTFVVIRDFLIEMVADTVLLEKPHEDGQVIRRDQHDWTRDEKPFWFFWIHNIQHHGIELAYFNTSMCSILPYIIPSWEQCVQTHSKILPWITYFKVISPLAQFHLHSDLIVCYMLKIVVRIQINKLNQVIRTI